MWINAMLPYELLEDTLIAQTPSGPTAARCPLLNLFIPNRTGRASDNKIVDCIKGLDGHRRNRHVFKEVDQTGRYPYVMVGIAGTRSRPSSLRHLQSALELIVRRDGDTPKEETEHIKWG